MSERSIEHAAFVVERVYDASADRVFAAWSDPQAKARWFDGPEAEVELDFRVGGWERRRGMLPPVSVATVELASERDGTRLVFTEQGAFLDGHEMTARREHGLGSLLDSLGQWLQSGRSDGG